MKTHFEDKQHVKASDKVNNMNFGLLCPNTLATSKTHTKETFSSSRIVA